MESAKDLILNLINTMAVVMVIAYIVTRSRFYSNILEKKFTVQNQVFLILLFGAFSIYATLSGIKILGAIPNIRDLGPIIAGLIAGPVVGLGAGLIGAIHRYSLGGFTAGACSLATITAGLIAGMVYKIRKGEFIGIQGAVMLAIFIELFHMVLILLISHPFDRALIVVEKGIPPMIMANGFGIGLYAYIIMNLNRERSTERIKTMMEGELRAAREIQMNILPKIVPPFTGKKEFEMSAVLEAANEVGGDLYDFFFIDDDRLFFIIGDVSGKGVPAALFMAVTQTLIKAAGRRRTGLAEILRLTNRDLREGNDSFMFVTVFCGILDTASGRMEYCNAGHNPPFIASCRNTIEPLSVKAGPPLGVFEKAVYAEKTTFLKPGDTLVLYTDGVTEAMDKNGNLFSEERLIQSLQESSTLSTESIRERIMADVGFFMSGAPQTDDITLLILRYHGNGSNATS